MLTYGISLLVVVVVFQILKYSIRRKRPVVRPESKRLTSRLTKAEHGTFSMPSGDASCVGLFCFLYTAMMGIPTTYIIMPLVMAGRVFYQCHWWGDTLCGVVIGTVVGAIVFTQFEAWAPLARLICGEGTFIPEF